MRCTSFLVLCWTLGFATPLIAQSPDRNGDADRVLSVLLAGNDANKDGKIDAQEWKRGEERFRRLDKNSDGVIDRTDFIDTATPRRERNRRAQMRRPDPPKVGAMAPDFTLLQKDGKSKATLSSFRGKRPVALIFGSYT